MHKHRCGLQGTVPGPGNEEMNGCGHVWAHERPEDGWETHTDYIAAHKCPECGRGPWLEKYYNQPSDRRIALEEGCRFIRALTLEIASWMK